MKVFKVLKCPLSEILVFRQLYLQEHNCQIRYNACHERNWTDSYLLMVDDSPVGYASMKGLDDLKDRDTVFESFLLPGFRRYSLPLFGKFLALSGATFFECQTNDHFTTSLFYEFAEKIHSDVILFAADRVEHRTVPNAIFRKRLPTDVTYHEKKQDNGEYIIAVNGEIVATGGFLLHYNRPFADLYMDVREDARRRGYGSFMIQELIKVCYEAGRVPAARCNRNNRASRATLVKGGLKVCGFMLTGVVRK